MSIHKYGIKIIFVTALLLSGINVLLYLFLPLPVTIFSATGSLVLLFIIIQFFRNPKRQLTIDENAIVSPADGEIVVIEKTVENEYFKEPRIQISVFMSVWNVHINRYPVSGKVVYAKHHQGKFLMARHPKSSVENEHTTLVISTSQKIEILFRQIAGIVARRIICTANEGTLANQSEEFGFIKFGSRMDIFLPADTQINVKLGEKVKAGKSILAFFQPPENQ